MLRKELVYSLRGKPREWIIDERNNILHAARKLSVSYQ